MTYSNKKKVLYSYLLTFGYTVFLATILLILWPLDKTMFGCFLLFGGLSSIALHPFVPEGVPDTLLSAGTKVQKRTLLWGGILTVGIGLVILLV